ncbi:TRAP transporter small permease subunit [Sulfuriferula nivalis]|uniref:TRAP transporter small permease protein n=1 Tax=Sulfuriferula nivalis TaxID=2675298 RepID=A0A809RNW8_9PROT|nr:TRAP transporter small permease subunit [Sulfuriferula nivalis]BBP00511.1 C4-dicarboxylate ABC transporter substrate-binding protein [Sulfuriferula nivalis]
MVRVLLRFAHAVDALNDRVGRSVKWLILLVTLISAVNALWRYTFGESSNAGLEMQWYLFGAVFLLAAGDTLKHNGHVRIDFIYGRLSRRGQLLIDIFGTVLFLLPFCALIIWFSWPMFMLAWQSGEMSPDAGGLLRWPVKLLIPVGFGLLGLQGIAELIKHAAALCEEPSA